MTAPTRSARDQAIAHIQAVRDSWYPTPIPAGVELDAIPADLLQKLHDERLMVDDDMVDHMVSVYRAYGMKDMGDQS